MKRTGQYGVPEESVRSKVQTAWNYVKYGKNIFELKTNFSDASPVWILAKHYHKRKDEKMAAESAAFEADFLSRIWFTYRKDFPVFAGSSLNTDCGWGCMLRTGQMMMAQALVMHCLGRDWRFNKTDKQSSVTDRIHRDIIRLFSDVPDYHASPLSVHNLVRLGRNIGKYPGNWFGPASVAYLIQLALANCQDSSQSLLSNLAVYVSQDCTVYKDDIIDMCTVRPEVSQEVTIHDFAVIDPPVSEEFTMHYSLSEEVTVDGENWCFEQESCRVTDPNWKSVVVFIPVRLGGERLNDLYSPCLKTLLTLPSCLGWIGGRPTHSLYFIGFQDNQLIHLDPHRLQSSVDTTDPNFSTHSYHTSHPRKISINKMDPSCCLGFYLRTRDEFEAWCDGIAEYSTPPDRGAKPQYPLFTVISGRDSPGSGAKEEWTRMDREATPPEDTLQTEDFVFL